MRCRENKNPFIKYLPMFGCISTGIIYVAIGVIAMLSFLKIRDGGADESSLVVLLNDFLIGKIVVWIILLGTLSYIVWRIYESIQDPYEYGKEAKGIVLRTGIALSTLPDALIAYSTILILLGKGNILKNGQPEEERKMVESMFQESWGTWLIVALGFIICLTAIVQLIYGITKGYRERQNMSHFNSGLQKLIHLLAWTGYLARSIIIGAIGFFFVKAGILENAQYVVNTDKAFDFIGDKVGHLYFILVAIGTICYGLFMFALGVTYTTDKD
jgi:hypothetical protein